MFYENFEQNLCVPFYDIKTWKKFSEKTANIKAKYLWSWSKISDIFNFILVAFSEKCEKISLELSFAIKIQS